MSNLEDPKWKTIRHPGQGAEGRRDRSSRWNSTESLPRRVGNGDVGPGFRSRTSNPIIHLRKITPNSFRLPTENVTRPRSVKAAAGRLDKNVVGILPSGLVDFGFE
jgi:hypothetical protein